MKSIRNQLLFVLTVVLTIAWALITVITYLESQHEVEEVFDSQMAQSAAVLSQFSTLSLLGKTTKDHRLEKEMYGHRYEKKLSFQIWENGQLILRSANAPVTPMANTPGYSDHTIDNEMWRVFALYISQNKIIYVAEKHEVREELIGEITLQALYPLTLALPVLMLLIRISLGQGLKPLRKLAREVEKRSSYNLEPVAEQADIPREISPIIIALNSLFLQVKSAFEREKRFTSDASHELRTPLAGIKVQAQVAMRADNNEQRQHALDKIIQSVDRSTYLVEQMLTLARLDPDMENKQFSFINLSQLVNNIIDEYHVQARDKQITIDYLPTDEDILVKGHETALAILVSNLLNNAILYSPERSQVSIKIVKENDTVQLLVIDTGYGIPMDERDTIFDRFYRGENTQHQQGAGLGLSIVKRIVDIHNSTLGVLDNPSGQGTCMLVTFKEQCQ
jgi:two-component system sensor histidine kinase QseC